jgi:hypothetical protein
MRPLRRLLPALLIAAVPGVLLAYGVRIHALLPSRALGGRAAPLGALVASDTLPGINDADIDAFRVWLWTRAAQLSDTSVRAAFRGRYPTVQSFDATAMKELLMMSARARVLGVDSFASVYRTMTRHDRSLDPNPDYIPGRPLALVTALQMGSIYPDLDRRNQARLLRGPDGAPRRTASGDTIPFDPMTLNMGRLTGLSSQGHAHYGLSRTPKSADPAILKKEPWNFAIPTGFPGPVETYGPDNAQIYSDLSALAALDGRPAWHTLSALYAGNAMHYVADVGNAIHTIQVGIYPIFVDATIQSLIRRFLTLFGLLGKAPSRNSIGIDIIGNLHSMSERLFETELTEAMREQGAGHSDSVRVSMRPSLRALEAGDDSLAGVLARALHEVPAGGDYGRVIAYAVVDANVRDGAEVYRVTRDIIDTRARIGRIAMDFDTIPDEELWRFIRVHRGAVIHTRLDDFNAVHARGLARTTTALRALWDRQVAVSATPPPARAALMDQVLTRLLSERLRYLAAAEARRSRWTAAHGGAR